LLIICYKDPQWHLTEEKGENRSPTNQERSAEKTSQGSGMPRINTFIQLNESPECYCIQKNVINKYQDRVIT